MSERDPSQQPSHDHDGIISAIGRRLDWPKTIMATLLISTGATAYAHGVNHEEGSVANGVQEFLTIDDEYTYEVLTDETTKTERTDTFKSRPSSQTEGVDKLSVKDANQLWAEEFAKDPNVDKYTNKAPIRAVVRRVNKLIQQGAEIESITITGHTSAEDDSNDAGLNSPSEKNEQLALARATATKNAIKSKLDNKDITFKIGAPVEDELTNSEIKKLDRVARNAGFDDSASMIKAWNRDPNSLNKKQGKLLQKLLGNQRKSEVSIKWSATGSKVYLEEEFCTIYHINEQKTETREDKIPYPLPVFVPLPILKRRRKEKPEEEKQQKEPRQPRRVRRVEKRISKINKKIDQERAKLDEIDGDQFLQGVSIEQRIRALGWQKEDAHTELVRMASRSNRANFAINATKILLPLAIILPNATGQNCKEEKHLPRPAFLVDQLWDIVDDASGHGADVEKDWNLGVPFVKSLQLQIAHDDYNWLIINPESTCQKEGDSSDTTNPETPECSEVYILRRNGKEINRQVVYQAGPFSTKRKIVKTP